MCTFAALGLDSVRAQEQAAGALASLALDNTKNEVAIAKLIVSLLAWLNAQDPEVQKRIIACANDLVKMSALQPSPVVDALLEGLDGELSKAIEPDNIGRWGGGALYAALSAHWNRICLNFRDPDMQMYQTEASADIRTKAASSFVQPPPTTQLVAPAP